MRICERKTSRGLAVAFTLVEVMIASAIFFAGMFSILALLSQGLKAAAMLRKDAPTAGMVVAAYCAETNAIQEESDSDGFGEYYPGYAYVRNTTSITNGLWEVDVVVTKNGQLDSALTTYLCSPGGKRGL
jgi:Tfp pilus assembly protein PilV